MAPSPGLEFDRWLDAPGWPPFLPDLSPGDALMRPAEALVRLWAAPELDLPAIAAVDIAPWKTYQLVYFLDQVLQRSPLPPGESAVLAFLLILKYILLIFTVRKEGSRV